MWPTKNQFLQGIPCSQSYKLLGLTIECYIMSMLAVTPEQKQNKRDETRLEKISFLFFGLYPAVLTDYFYIFIFHSWQGRGTRWGKRDQIWVSYNNNKKHSAHCIITWSPSLRWMIPCKWSSLITTGRIWNLKFTRPSRDIKEFKFGGL